MNDYLREYLNLTGTKFGCGVGACSACVVILDNADGTSSTIHTCITGADFFAGKSRSHHRGHRQAGQADARCRPPSSTISPSSAATARRASSTRRRCWSRASPARRCRRPRWRRAFSRAMDGHICRCTGYVRYYAALARADPRRSEIDALITLSAAARRSTRSAARRRYCRSSAGWRAAAIRFPRGRSQRRRRDIPRPRAAASCGRRRGRAA